MTNEEFIQSITLEGEEWRDIAGYEGIYAVSSMGRIASLRTEKYYKNTLKPQKIERGLKKLSIFKSRNNVIYHVVTLYLNGKGKSFRVHRLVAETFIPNPCNYPQVDHINTIGTDNRIKNLRWCTNSMNMQNPITRSRCKQPKTYLNGRSRKVIKVEPNGCNTIYNSLTEAANSCNITRVTIANICSGKTKTPRGVMWMYLSDYESLINKSKNA